MDQIDADTATCPPGKRRERYSFGNGLYLDVLASGRKTWTLRRKIDGRETNRRIGNAADITLIEARRIADGTPATMVKARRAQIELELAEAQEQVNRLELELDHQMGLNDAREQRMLEYINRNTAAFASLTAALNAAGLATPVTATATTPSFRDYADQAFNTKRTGWRDSTAKNWRRTADKHVLPTLGDSPIAEITSRQVADLLNGLSNGVFGMAKTVLKDTFDFAKANDAVPNSPMGTHLNVLLRRDKTGTTKHHNAMDFRALPAFYQSLESPALKAIILTATRANETLKATWNEIDADAATWTIPADRMKAKRPHTVPLSAQALDAMRQARTPGRSHVFSLQTRDAGLYPRMLYPITKEAGTTLHGFRTAFRQWCQHVEIPFELAELSLAHQIGNQTQRAYERDTMLEQRRAVMQRWANYLDGTE